MSEFFKILKELKPQYSYEVGVCETALLLERAKLRKKVQDLTIELSGIPTTGLFGENLRGSKERQLKELNAKLRKL